MSKTFSLVIDNQVPAGAEQLPLAALSSLARKELSLDEMGRRIRDSWYSQYRRDDDETADFWVREIFMDRVIIEAPDGLYAYPYTISADGTNIVNLTNNPADEQGPVYSPDGNKLIFISNRDGAFNIFVMNADGTNQ
ncbi:MAG: hypothetical protein KKB13_09955, partial [Chloroflexi bacterium]|nr:hypothetical protein [Chloroflexota bacterium]